MVTSLLLNADDSFATRVMSVKYSGFLPIDVEGNGNSHMLPMIVASGLGERVVYYATPLENFMAPDSKLQAPSIIENMYFGMIEGN